MHSEHDWEAWADALADREYVVIDGYLPDELLALLEHFFQQHQDALQQADRKSTRLNSSHSQQSRMPSSA